MADELHCIGLRAFLRALAVAETNYAQARVMGALSRLPGRIVSYPELIDELYGEREDGGAQYPRDVIRVAVMRLRKHGAQIVSHKGRGYSYARVP